MTQPNCLAQPIPQLPQRRQQVLDRRYTVAALWSRVLVELERRLDALYALPASSANNSAIATTETLITDIKNFLAQDTEVE